MAMQTGIASSKVIILVGAGLTSSILLKNGGLSDALLDLQELIKGIGDKEVLPTHYDASFLVAQIQKLAQDIKDLSQSNQVTIVNGDSTSRGTLASYLLPAAAVGAMGYCYMQWKTTKKHLSCRLENLDWKLDEQKETTELIRNEVNGVNLNLSEIGYDIESIQKMVCGLEGKLELLENKQEVTNSGIWYLCQFAGGIKDGLNAKLFQESSLNFQPPNLSLPVSEDKSVKGLQFLTETLKPREAELKTGPVLHKGFYEKPPSKVFSTAIHRSFPAGISLIKEGLL